MLTMKEVIMHDLSELCSIDWENKFDGLDVNTMWITFHDKFIQLVNKYIPTI